MSAKSPEALVIGADQVLACEGQLFDKPGNLATARLQLRRLRGRTHHLHTGVALAHNQAIVWQAPIRLTLYAAFQRCILAKLFASERARPSGTVGAYEIEGIGIQLFASVSGDISTIIGLTMLPLLKQNCGHAE